MLISVFHTATVQVTLILNSWAWVLENTQVLSFDWFRFLADHTTLINDKLKLTDTFEKPSPVQIAATICILL